MEIENAMETLNSHIEDIIVKRVSETINALERLRCKYLAKIDLINHQIKKSENKLLSEITNEFSEAKPVEVIEKKQRGRPKKIYPTIMPEIINDVIIDTYETEPSVDIQV